MVPKTIETLKAEGADKSMLMALRSGIRMLPGAGLLGVSILPVTVSSLIAGMVFDEKLASNISRLPTAMQVLVAVALCPEPPDLII